MRVILTTLAAAGILTSAALAQTSGSTGTAGSTTGAPAARSPAAGAPNTGTGSSNPAVDVKPAGSPETTGSIEPGANSFTEGQARSRIEAQGFQNVTDLKKDDQGIWRGRATQNGQSVNVMLDYRGNIATQ